MKKIFFCLLFAPLISVAQKDTVITYTEVVPVQGVSKDQLFQRARNWFNDAFKSSKDVLQIQDKETGELIGKGTMKSIIEYRIMGIHKEIADYYFSFKISVKEGRYKYEMTNFDNYLIHDRKDGIFGILTSSEQCPVKMAMVRQNKMDEYWKSAKEHIGIDAKAFTETLKKAMQKEPVNF